MTKNVLLLGCFSATPMTQGEWNTRRGWNPGPLHAIQGYHLVNELGGRDYWLTAEELELSTAELPDDFYRQPLDIQVLLAEKIFIQRRIAELEAGTVTPGIHPETEEIRADGLTHLQALREVVLAIDQQLTPGDNKDSELLAEKRFLLARLTRLFLQRDLRLAHCKRNGSFDPYCEKELTTHIELVQGLIAHIDHCLTCD